MPRKVVYSGISVVEVDDLEPLFRDRIIPLQSLPTRKYFQNENLVLKASNSASALAIVKGDSAVLIQVTRAYGIEPKNKEQALALGMLMDPQIRAVTLTGNAGTGKTLLTVAAALQQSIGSKALYRRIVYIKSVVPVGEKIGFLPGTMDEKIDPFFGALYDSLELVKPGKEFDKLVGFDDKAKIQKMAASFVRGRTFRKTFVIVDEAQNFSVLELKTMLTRLDEDSKVVVLGDADQSDVVLKPENEGLVRLVETFKDDDLFGHIDLIKSMRSRLAQLVSEKL